MSTNPTDMRSRLKRVKGLGAAHHGVSHWWLQRVTAVAIIPLSLWFMCSLVTVLLTPNVLKVAEWFASPVSTILMVMLLVAVFTHAKLGLQVVIEDYIKCAATKFTLLLANNFICSILIGVGILAVLKLHFLDIASTM
jgi:succinate dehydrogenase / fumarate reductase membrane anchor subunit